MPDTATTGAREAEAQIAKFREDFQKLRQEFLDDDKIDKEEEDILKDVENMIAQVEAKIAAKKTGSVDAVSAATEIDVGRFAWDVRTSDYGRLIVAADALQKEGNPNAPTLKKFLNRIADAVAEDRWGEAVELLDLAQMTVESATGGSKDEDADPAQAKWDELSGDYDGVVNEINELRSDDHPDVERFEGFVTQMDRAVSEERWNDAIETLDLAQSSLGAAGFVPEGAGEGPEASEALAELEEAETEAQAEPSQDSAEATPSPKTAEASDDSSEDEDEEEWLQMAGQLDEFQQLMQQLLQAGHGSATGMTSLFSDILEARSESRWQDAIMLLTSALASARALAREIGGDSPAPGTTDPVVPGVTPDGPGGEEPVEPGQISPSTASISGSVGKGGKNKAEDVTTVQQLLNQNGASPALDVDGAVGPKTNGAISKFQQANLGFQDGCVDPGGQTWNALTGGGGGAAPPIEFNEQDELRKLIDETPEPLPPTVIVEEDEDEDEEDDANRPKPEGDWVDAEFSVTTPLLSITVKTDENGKVTEVALAKNLIEPISFQKSIRLFAFGASVAPSVVEISFSGTGPKVPLQTKHSAKGSCFVGPGVVAGDAIAAFIVEVELEAASDLPVSGVIDLDNLRESSIDVPDSAFSFPFELFLNGSIKAGVVIEAKGSGAKGLVKIKAYDKLVILKIDAGPKLELRTGPGFDELISDIESVFDFVVENPETIRTGPTAEIPEGAIDDAKDYIEEKVEEIKDYIEEKVEEAEEIYDDVKEYVEEKVEEAKEFVKEKAEELEETYDDAKDYVEEKGEEILDDILDIFSDDDDEK